MSETFQSQWVKHLDEVQPFARSLIIHGNIKDAVYYENQYFHSIRRFLDTYFKNKEYELIGHYDLLDGLEFYTADYLRKYNQFVETAEIKDKNAMENYQVPGEPAGDTASNASRIDPSENFIEKRFSAGSLDFYETFTRIRNLFNLKECPPAVFIIHFSDHLVGSQQQLDLSERTNIILLMKIIESARFVQGLNQCLIIVADEIRKIPISLYFENPRVRRIHIPQPTIVERKHFVGKFYNLFHHTTDRQDEKSHIESLAICTEGLSNVDLHNLALLSARHQIPINDAKKLVKRYKFGRQKSPWDSLSREKILGTPWQRLKKNKNGLPVRGLKGGFEIETVPLSLSHCLMERVIGQNHAVDAVETMIIRTVEGIYSTKSSESFTKPKGVFLFCGPTGVGKTELTKALTEWLFGEESAMIRFDMSEFNQEHSDQKLIGSPPGYVGHEQGGQLTNRVRKKPFCVILFDEVDKMHPKIWDIFLQILDDGRLTDGTGETVHFSETVIIMTSNLGGAEHPFGKTNKEIRNHYLNAVRSFFRQRLGRPEILNRIGMDNVIPFNSIEKDFQEKIIRQKLDRLGVSYSEKFNLILEFDPSVVNYLLNDPEGFTKNGARGVENLITTHIINPLSRYLFYNPDIKAGGKTLYVKIYPGEITETVFMKTLVE